MDLCPSGFAPDLGVWVWSMWLLESCNIQVEGFGYLEAHSLSQRKNTRDPFPERVSGITWEAAKSRERS